MTYQSDEGRHSVRRRKRNRWLLAVGAFLLVLVIAVILYGLDYYHATKDALDVSAAPGVFKCDGGWAVGDPGAQSALVFYPGGKVEARAYLPLLQRISQGGVFCVLCEMPLNLAVLDINAAGRMMKRFPDVKRWFIGGHSLGGSMAAQYASGHPEEILGVILLGAYSPAEISGQTPVLLLYGSEDGVMNRDKYGQALALLTNYSEVVIPGGNHAGFGDYGAQAGDGQAAISPEAQQTQAAKAILRFMEDGETAAASAAP